MEQVRDEAGRFICFEEQLRESPFVFDVPLAVLYAVGTQRVREQRSVIAKWRSMLGDGDDADADSNGAVKARVCGAASASAHRCLPVLPFPPPFRCLPPGLTYRCRDLAVRLFLSQMICFRQQRCVVVASRRRPPRHRW